MNLTLSYFGDGKLTGRQIHKLVDAVFDTITLISFDPKDVLSHNECIDRLLQEPLVQKVAFNKLIPTTANHVHFVDDDVSSMTGGYTGILKKNSSNGSKSKKQQKGMATSKTRQGFFGLVVRKGNQWIGWHPRGHPTKTGSSITTIIPHRVVAPCTNDNAVAVPPPPPSMTTAPPMFRSEYKKPTNSSNVPHRMATGTGGVVPPPITAPNRPGLHEPQVDEEGTEFSVDVSSIMLTPLGNVPVRGKQTTTVAPTPIANDLISI